MDLRKRRLTGAMVDIVQAIGEDALFVVRLEVMPFAALLPALTSGKVDMIAAAMLRTKAREQIVDFTEPILSYGGGVVSTHADSRQYRDIADLKGSRVGVQMGTRFGIQAEQAGASVVRYYDSLPDALHDLHAGRIDTVYGDAPILAYQIAHIPASGLRFAAEFHPPSVEDVCLVVRKGDATLLGEVNASLDRLRRSRLPAILRAWGLQA